jgi:hypothetical protein
LGEWGGRAVAVVELLKLLHPIHAGFDCGEVGQGAPQPPFCHVRHGAALGLFFHGPLGLFLCSNEKNLPGKISQEVSGLFEFLKGLQEINDIDPVSRAEYVGLHLGIPPFGLVAEMGARFQQVFQGHLRHKSLTSKHKNSLNPSSQDGFLR